MQHYVVDISAVTAHGLRNLDGHIPLADPLTVLIGENKVGKSNVIDALRLILEPHAGPRARRWITPTEGTASGTTTSTYNAADELTGTSGPGGGNTYSYDLDGNELTGAGATFTYDLAGRTRTALVSGTTTAYAYDGDGNRVLASTGSQASKKTPRICGTPTPPCRPSSGRPTAAAQRSARRVEA